MKVCWLIVSVTPDKGNLGTKSKQLFPGLPR
jgi:hypothetical protein